MFSATFLDCSVYGPVPMSDWSRWVVSTPLGSSIVDHTCSGTIGIVPSTCWTKVASGCRSRNSTDRSPVGTTSASVRGTAIWNGVKVFDR